MAILAGEQVTSHKEVRERGHAERLAPIVSEVLSDAGVTLRDVKQIAVTRGPGSFTGVRVGLAFARGLAVGRNLPVTGITTLQALACGLKGRTADKTVLVDARRGQVYGQVFSHDNLAKCDPFILATEEAAERLPSPGPLDVHHMAGTGVPLVYPDLAGEERWQGHQPDPVDIAYLAQVAPMSEVPPSALYLRAADAKPAKKILITEAL